MSVVGTTNSGVGVSVPTLTFGSASDIIPYITYHQYGGSTYNMSPTITFGATDQPRSTTEHPLAWLDRRVREMRVRL